MAYRGGDSVPKSSEVVFFLGAGASVKAGVPTTYSFVNEYTESISDPGKKKTIKKIISTLEQWNQGEKIDIELLLESLTKLRDKDKEPLLSFYTSKTFILDDYYEKEPLINDLKNFIKDKAIVESEEKIRYLQSFRDLIDESRPLDIISVNYDTCIEQFCNCYRLVYQDGFDVYWNPAVFQKEHTDIRLYKIHGSVMWYQSDRGGYIKLPVMVRENKVQLITGENAENLMLYPMQKWNYAEPLLELLVEVKHLLEFDSCKFLIIVGYSFRDEHITQILWDVARKNRELHFLLIDPCAHQIYNDKLKYYSSSEKIPSSMDGRVICLPYLFEKVFPYIKNYYLKKLKDGIKIEVSQHQGIIQGEKPNSILILQYFADAEYTEKIESILKIEPIDDEIYWSIKLEIYLKLAVNLVANKESEKGETYFRDFCNILNKVMVERIDVNFVDAVGMIGVYQIEVKFNSMSQYDSKRKIVTGSSSNDVTYMKNIIEPLLKFCKIRMEFNDASKSGLTRIFRTLENIKKYLDTLDDGKISFEEYVELRTNKITNIEQFIQKFETSKLHGDTIKQRNDLNTYLVDVERRTLKEIIYSD